MSNFAKELGQQLNRLIQTSRQTSEKRDEILNEFARLVDNCARADSELIDTFGHVVPTRIADFDAYTVPPLPPGIMPGSFPRSQ